MYVYISIYMWACIRTVSSATFIWLDRLLVQYDIVMGTSHYVYIHTYISCTLHVHIHSTSTHTCMYVCTAWINMYTYICSKYTHTRLMLCIQLLCIGICTGPRKEFWCLYCQELASGREKIFTPSDNGQLMYVMSVLYVHVRNSVRLYDYLPFVASSGYTFFGLF